MYFAADAEGEGLERSGMTGVKSTAAEFRIPENLRGAGPAVAKARCRARLTLSGGGRYCRLKKTLCQHGQTIV